MKCKCSKVLIGFSAGLLAAGPLPAAAGDAATKSYTILFNGNAMDIDPGETVTAKMPDGRDIEIQLIRNPEVTFRGDGFSFRHSSDYQVARSNPADDISQYLIVTGSGTLVLVQSYKDMNPASLNTFMLEQTTADDVKAGGKVDSSPAQRAVANGIEMSGLKAAIINGPAKAEIEVMSGKTSTGGIIAISRIDADNEQADRAFVEKFWATLSPE